MLSIRHIIGIFSPEHGGPVVSLRNYAMGQAQAGCRVSVRTLEGYPGTSPAVKLPSPIDQQIFRVGWPTKLGRSHKMAQFLEREESPDVYHLHGAWLRAMHYGQQEARRRRCPYLVQINGAYQLYELRRKPWRKRLVRLWFQDQLLHTADCLHVNSSREAVEMRSLGFTRPMVVIPAGFDLAEAARLEPANLPVQPWPEIVPKNYFLYLARLHPNKGIELLLEAWRELAADFPDIKLLIVGAGESAYVEHISRILRTPELYGRCEWKGFVSEEEKAWCFRNAQFYCLPSFTENFGNTVQEALGFGTPVLTTTETPWSDLPSQDCGWLTECSLSPLKERLREALSLDPLARRQMGQNGVDYIKRDFSLDSVVKKQIRVYEWLTGGSAPSDLFYTAKF